MRTKPRISVATVLAVLSTPQRRKEVIKLLRDLRAAHMETVTIDRINPVSYGRALHRLRADANILQKEMAAKLNVSTTLICLAETGKGNLGLTETILFLHHCLEKTK